MMDRKRMVHKDYVPENSSMAKNLEEVKALGQQMEHMNTNQELQRKGLEPDPMQ
ncbi:hypothetical protein [Bacillus massiliigorillae]|uniref:hypothetical protein n=1 Tax=Bacillus massiliigorillae TaxID=1243664 RepID=UPI0018A86BA4|nr:hypothetical protein [Bacillus massiliigorillae]